MAASANMYKAMFSHRGKFARQCSARFIPVTVPRRIARDCRRMANRFESKTMKRSWKRVCAPAETSVA